MYDKLDNRHIFTMKLRSIVQQKYYVPLQLHFCSDHMLTAFSSHAFSAAAPAVWNSLDIDTQSVESFLTFRRKLKTELFIKSHDTWTLGRHRCAPDSHATNILGALQFLIRLD